MSHCACGKIAALQCSHHPQAVFCGTQCVQVGNHPCFATIDGGAKRERSKSPPRRKDSPKKGSVAKEKDLWDVVLHTLQHTPQMIENLANVLTLKQLRSLKQSGRGLYNSVWKNSHFWYYVVKRFRPEHAGDFYDQNKLYKEYAMRTFIAPDKTVMDPSVDEGFPPMLAKILKIVMTNAAALEILIRDVDIVVLLGWARVSREFYRIVFKSNYFWYLMNTKFGDLQDVYRYNVNYYQKAQEEIMYLFKVAITLKVSDEEYFTFTNPFIASKRVHNGQYKLTHLDVKMCGGLQECLHMFDSFDLNISDEYHLEVNYIVSDHGERQDFETTTEGIPSLEDMMKEYYSIEQVEKTQFSLSFELYVDYSIPSYYIVRVIYPKSLIPVYRDEGQLVPLTILNYTESEDSYMVRHDIEFYRDDTFVQFGHNFEDVDATESVLIENLPREFRIRASKLSKDFRLARSIPSALIHHGFVDVPLDTDDSWETVIEASNINDIIKPGVVVSFQEVAQIIEQSDPQDGDWLTITIRKRIP